VGPHLEQTGVLPEAPARTHTPQALSQALQRAAALLARRLPSASTWAALSALLAASLLSLRPVWSQPGWPANHEAWVWATRAGVLRAAWQRGEWLPLWWSEGNRGFGSPMPALYHKLQNLVCTLLLELVGNIEWAELLSLLLFGMLGCIGLRKLALRLGASPWTATVHALLLPFTNYVTVDWLIRGAFAEHAAFMLLPWLLLGLLELIEHGHVRVGLLCGTMIALFYAHSMTALYSIGLSGIALLIALARHWRQSGRILARGVLAALGFCLAIAPTLWVMRVMAEHFFLDHAISGVYQVQRHLTSLNNALFLGQVPDPVTFYVAPDLELWVAIAGAALLAVPRRWRASTARSWADPALAFLISGCVLMTFLRLEAAKPLYDHVPGLRYIQFPWRLLSFMTVLLLALSAALFGRLPPRLATPLACAVLAVLVAHTHRRYHESEEARLPREPHAKLVASMEPNHHVKWWEYLPAVPGPASDEDLIEWARAPATLSSRCQVRFEGCARCFVTECSAPGSIALPYAFSGLELVTDGAGRSVPAYREQDDPRVQVDVGAGRTALRYRKPGWSSVLRRWWLSFQR